MKKFDVILFDADDTLFDFQKSEKEALKKTLEDYGIDNSEKVLKEYNRINKQKWEEYNKGNITKKELQTSRFVELFDIFNILLDSEEANKSYLANLAENSFLFHEAEEVCKELSKNFKLVIVTNSVAKVAHRRIGKSDINQYISQIFVSEEAGFQKPRIEFFDYVFKHFPDINKDRMIIIGDSLTTDIQGGINAGIETCWFNVFNIENKTDIKPTYEIKNLNQIFDIIYQTKS